jgi:hypothetical protein
MKNRERFQKGVRLSGFDLIERTNKRKKKSSRYSNLKLIIVFLFGSIIISTAFAYSTPYILKWSSALFKFSGRDLFEILLDIGLSIILLLAYFLAIGVLVYLNMALAVKYSNIVKLKVKLLRLLFLLSCIIFCGFPFVLNHHFMLSFANINLFICFVFFIGVFGVIFYSIIFLPDMIIEYQ